MEAEKYVQRWKQNEKRFVADEQQGDTYLASLVTVALNANTCMGWGVCAEKCVKLSSFGGR